METLGKETIFDRECKRNFNNSSMDLKEMDFENIWTEMD